MISGWLAGFSQFMLMVGGTHKTPAVAAAATAGRRALLPFPRLPRHPFPTLPPPPLPTLTPPSTSLPCPPPPSPLTGEVRTPLKLSAALSLVFETITHAPTAGSPPNADVRGWYHTLSPPL